MENDGEFLQVFHNDVTDENIFDWSHGQTVEEKSGSCYLYVEILNTCTYTAGPDVTVYMFKGKFKFMEIQ